MDNRYIPTGIAGIDRASFDAGLRSHMQRVFNLMGVGLAVTGLIAYLVAHSALMVTLTTSPLRWVVALAPLGIAMYMGFRMQRMSAASLQATFWGFCVAMGLSMASIFVVYTGDSIAKTFFITAGMFGATSLWGYTTKRDLSAMGSFFGMAVWGLIIAGVVNMFLMSPMLHWVTSVVGVVLFTGLTAFDMQRIKESYAESAGTEANSKLAVFGALMLYMDFVNMFVYLLQLTGALQRDNR